MERKFQIGDLVKLKSDSENCISMTVIGYEIDFVDPLYAELCNENTVVCAWRDEHGKPYKENYHQDALQSCINQ